MHPPSDTRRGRSKGHAEGRTAWSRVFSSADLPPRQRRARRRHFLVYLVTVLFCVWWIRSADWETLRDAFFEPEIFREQFPEVLTQAARNTLWFTLLGFSGGLTLGLFLALMRFSDMRLYRWAASVFVEVVRGLPALLTIFLVGYGIPLAFDVRIPGIYGPGAFSLAIVSSAYIAETIRAGIEAVPKGQMEAARSLGMPRGVSMTFIVLPQAFRIVIPPLTNELVLLLKDTSLLYALGTTDQTRELIKFGRDEMTEKFNVTPLIVVGLVYLVITLPLTRVAAWLERRARLSRE